MAISDECNDLVPIRVTSPSYTVGVNAALISFIMFSMLGAIIFQLRMKKLKSYPRMKVRSSYGFFNSYASVCVIVIAGPFFDLIGSEKYSCLASVTLTLLAFGLFNGTLLYRLIIYFYRVNISKLKEEKLTLDEFVSFKTSLKKKLILSRYLFLSVPLLAMAIYNAVANAEIHWFNRCFGCEPIDTVTAICCLALISATYVYAAFLMMITRSRRDVFAQIAEYRLILGLGYHLVISGLLIIILDPKNLNSNYVFRGQWLITLGFTFSFIVQVPYQLYLASVEGQDINPSGSDFLSVIWHWISGIRASNKRESKALKVSLADFLASGQDAVDMFSSYLLSEYCSELLDFYLKVEALHAFGSNVELGQEMIKNIFATHIQTNSPLQINISALMRGNIENTFISCDPRPLNIFDSAADEILNMLQTGPFIRFRRTTEYANWASLYQQNADSPIKKLRSTLAISKSKVGRESNRNSLSIAVSANNNNNPMDSNAVIAPQSP